MEERGVTVTPNIKPGVLTVHPDVQQMKAEGIFVKASDTDEPAVGTWWGGEGHFADFTDSHTRDVWKGLLKSTVLEFGTSSVWNDNCEYDSVVDKDSRCAFEGRGGSIGQLKAVMANLMCHVTVEAIRESHGDARPYIVCRSGHAGIQRYAQTWAGDNLTCWESLEYNIATILGMGLSGVANQGCDVCGFYGPSPEPELMVRWIQNGIFQPRFSIHSVNTDNTVTEPWMYHEHVDRIREAIRFRYRLFPYLYSLMARAHRSGLPIMEPMCSAFQHDSSCYDEGIDFMVGDALLVANVVTKGATTRKVYLPKGERFYDFRTREVFEGGQTIELPVGLSDIPLFLRGGTILPLAMNQLDNLARQDVTGLHIICAPDRDGSFQLYEDDGTTRAHETGEFRITEIRMRVGSTVQIDLVPRGPFSSPIRDAEFDVIHRDRAPFWVSIEGEQIPHFLDRDVYEGSDVGWYYSQTLKSVLIRTPLAADGLHLEISFEEFDMIGI